MRRGFFVFEIGIGTFERAGRYVTKPPLGNVRRCSQKTFMTQPGSAAYRAGHLCDPVRGHVMSIRSDVFVRRWVADNVIIEPDVQDPADEADHLACEILIDAAKRGITESELKETTGGNITGYLRAAYEWSHDPSVFG
jgi:hypothetical protein